jgi:hypothetical protein
MTTSENTVRYALISDSVVSNIVLFENASAELLEEAKSFNNADIIMPVPEKFLNPPHLLCVDSVWDGETFILPKPFESWVLNSDKDWVAPVARPEDGNLYIWNEETVSWDIVSVVDTPEDHESINN